MDTKSRSIKYSYTMKAIAVCLIWLSLAGLYAAGVFFGVTTNDMMHGKYYESDKFIREFRLHIDSVIRSTEVQKLSEIVVESAVNNGNVTGYELSSSVNFRYLVRNKKTNTFVTNMELDDKYVKNAAEEFKKNRTYLSFSVADRDYSFSDALNLFPERMSYLNSMREALHYAPIEFYAAVEDQLISGDVFYDIQQKNIKAHDRLPIFIIIAIAAFIIGLCSFIYLTMVIGRNEKDGEVKPAMVDWFYNDFHTFVVLLAVGLSFPLAEIVANALGDDIYKLIGIFVLLSIDLLIGLSYIFSMIRHIKRRTLFKHTLIYSLFRATAHILLQCFAAKTFKPAVIFMFLAYSGVNAILFAIATHLDNGGFPFMMIILLLFNVAAIYYISKALASLSGIMLWVKEMTKGNLEYALDTVNMSQVFTAFVKDISSLQTGIKQAVLVAVKGERLKTELITNVSHDLKTPLTSIINYVDLLKKENLDNETVNEYIGVLEDKSAKLKKLVDDLLEASKAVSGDLTVNYGSIDLCALAEQSVAEYSEKAVEAALDFRIKVCEKPAVVHGDGTLMWRIMDNLLSNVVKYSQKNSRVYIDIEDTGISGIVTVKNISEAPLDISSDQLLERFVRGDRSRGTEGSGLGLSIAKSLAELQGGTLELKVDGDLFKVVVKLPLEMVEG